MLWTVVKRLAQSARVAIVSGVVALLLAALATAAGCDLGPRLAAQQPPRDPLAPQSAEPAVIRGRVTTLENARPVRRAMVEVAPRPEVGESAALTDEDGRYELRVPPGRYTVRARKAGLIAQAHGQRVGAEAGTPLELTAGQIAQRVNIALSRGGAVAGVLYDPYGDPVVGAPVRALRFRYTGGGWRLIPTGRRGDTDDRGAFRIYGLPPGDYYLTASFPRRGSDTVPAPRYAPTFYSGTTDVQTAQIVRVGLSAEVPGLEFRLLTTPTASVSGRVVDERGAPVGNISGMSLLRFGPVANSGAFGAAVDATGRFTVAEVPPGDYLAYVTLPAGEGTEARFATANVGVFGGDVDGVVLSLTAGAQARGRIMFDDGVVPDFTPDSVVPFSSPRGAFVPPVGRGVGHVNDDWTFELRGMSGPQLVRLSGLKGDYRVRAVGLSGRDIIDTAVEFPTRAPTTDLAP